MSSSATSPSRLLERLNASSAPYVDPLAELRWESVDTDAWWLPPAALSLAGVAEFEALPLASRRRLSHYEFAYLLEAGLWLEAMFIERLGGALDREPDPERRRYYLHEIREEAGHSLMFLELLGRAGVRIPAAAHPRSALGTAVGRLIPFSSALFWTITVVGEELGDRLNRMIPRGVEEVTVSAVVYHMARLHARDEARHIAHTRAVCAEAVRGLPRWRLAALSPLVAAVLAQHARRLYYPPRALYAAAGLPAGVDWRRRAHANPTRRVFAEQAAALTAEFLRSIGWRL
ncbi:MAG: diiron oxygenase [Burkholderiales bacterium]|nr:diiron oxygenase [Burkholderiales bacterium]